MLVMSTTGSVPTEYHQQYEQVPIRTREGMLGLTVPCPQRDTRRSYCPQRSFTSLNNYPNPNPNRMHLSKNSGTNSRTAMPQRFQRREIAKPHFFGDTCDTGLCAVDVGDLLHLISRISPFRNNLSFTFYPTPDTQHPHEHKLHPSSSLFLYLLSPSVTRKAALSCCCCCCCCLYYSAPAPGPEQKDRKRSGCS